MATSRRCLLGLGSNLGNRLANLQDALRRVSPAFEPERVSSLYESDAVGPGAQPSYLNAVSLGSTVLDAPDLLRALKAVEWQLGRRPGPRWGPRPADLDILWLDGVAIATPELTIPHPRIGERPFVLLPLSELVPDLRLAHGATVSEAAARAARDGVRLVAGPAWRSAVAVFPPAIVTTTA